jgi:hypothetical protein
MLKLVLVNLQGEGYSKSITCRRLLLYLPFPLSNEKTAIPLSAIPSLNCRLIGTHPGPQTQQAQLLYHGNRQHPTM